MALDSTPPWLNVGPQSFGDAAATGARLDLARQQADTEAAQNQLRLSIQKTQSDRDFALQSEQHALDAEVKRTQLRMAGAQMARKFQAQQQYQQLVAGGMEPPQAMLRVGPALGVNMVGAGQLAHWGTPPPPPSMVTIGGKQFAQYNRTLHPIKQGPSWQDEDIDGNHFQRNTETNELKPVSHGGGMNAPGAVTPQTKLRINVLQNRIKTNAGLDSLGQNPKIQSQILKDQQEIDQLTGGGQEGQDDDQQQSSPAAAPGGNPQSPIQMQWNPTLKRYMMPRQ